MVGIDASRLETLTALPRGTGAMGFYEKAEEKAPIRAALLAADLPMEKRAPLERLRTDTGTFAAYVESRRNRREPFFVEPLGHVDLCNVAIPVRLISAKSK